MTGTVSGGGWKGRREAGRIGLLLVLLCQTIVACQAAEESEEPVAVEVLKVGFDRTSNLPVVILSNKGEKRAIPIWIGPFEADAITIQLQGIEAGRPMTHDLLRQITESLDGEITHVVISDLQNETFFAEIVLEANGETVEIDSRPSDAVALAVRVDVPIYVADEVMDRAGMKPEEELGPLDRESDGVEEEVGETGDEDLDVFRDFIEGLDIDN
jgi:bifunctional DNase/RNase